MPQVSFLRVREVGGNTCWRRLIEAPMLTAAERARVADVYAFCRVTDDLVDGDETLPVAVRSARLDAWHALCRRAWERGDTGIPTLAAVCEAVGADVADAGSRGDAAEPRVR